MTWISPVHLVAAFGSLGLLACGENTTEPATTGRDGSTAPSLAVASNSWIVQPDLAPVRYEFGMAAITNALGQSVLYAIAGRAADNTASRRVQAYNVSTKKWTYQPSLPLALYLSNGAGAIKGKIYISGGILNSRRARSDLYMFDRSTSAWTKKTSMPGPGFSGVTGVINNQLYVLTSCVGGDGVCDPYVPSGFYRYNPVTDRWTSLQTPSTTHLEGMGAVIGGKFYVVGGQFSSGQLDVYDPATNQWTIKAPMPEQRSLGAAASAAGQLYVFGGVRMDPEAGSALTVATTKAYNPATDTWTEKAPMPTPRMGIAASRVVVNGQVRIEVAGLNRPGNNLQYIP
jgi:N-acetylneuraminic acid mutarotase